MTATPTGSDEPVPEAAAPDALGSAEAGLGEALRLPAPQPETIMLIRTRATPGYRVVTAR